MPARWLPASATEEADCKEVGNKLTVWRVQCTMDRQRKCYCDWRFKVYLDIWTLRKVFLYGTVPDLALNAIAAGSFLAAAVWGGQRGDNICIWGPRILDDVMYDWVSGVIFDTSYVMPRCEYSYYVTLISCNQFYRGHRGQSSHRGSRPLATP